MAALPDATLLAISRISVGTPVTDDTDFTAMTPAQVAAKYGLSSYGGDAGSSLYALGSDGDYHALDPDDPPVTDLGLWSETAHIQHAFSNLCAGAVTGTLGSGGALPTGWTEAYTTQGYTVDITTGQTAFGLPVLRIRCHGTPSLSGWYPYISARLAHLPFLAASEHKVYARLVAGSLPMASKYAQGGIYGPATNNYVRSVASLLPAGTLTDAWSLLRVPAQRVEPEAHLYPVIFRTDQTSGVAYDFTIELCAPSLIMPGSATQLLTETTGAATTTKLAAITQREVSVWKPFVVVIEATTGEDPGAHQVFYSLSRSADELIEVYRATSTDQMTLKIRSGGVDYTKALGSVADNTAFTVAINVFASFTAASLNGGTVQVLTAPKPSGVLTLESIGCKHDGTLQCGGPITECNLIHPAVWNAAQLEAA